MMRLLLVSLFAISLLSSCTKKNEQSTELKEAQKTQSAELVVGTDAAYAPFESETADKTIVGFDIDVLKAIAEKSGLKLRFVNTPWEGLFNQLDSGDRDILVSAITINDERKKVMEFSEPYFEAVQLIVLPLASKVSNFSELKNKKIGVQTGTTGDEVASGLLGKTNDNIKRFEGTPLALQELSARGVDAVIADNGVVDNFMVNNKGDFKSITDPSFKKEYYGIAVKKGNVELLKKINDGLAAIKADGTYDKIYQNYFGKK